MGLRAVYDRLRMRQASTDPTDLRRTLGGLLDEMRGALDRLSTSDAARATTTNMAGVSAADLAFGGEIELRSFLHRLAHAGTFEALVELQVDVATSLRHILGAFFGADRLAAEAEEEALATRREMAHVRQVAAPEIPPGPKGVKARLRSVGNALARAFGSTARPVLRADEALLLHKIASRIGAALRDATATPMELERVFRDVTATLDLVLQTSSRASLRAHDARSLGELATALASAAPQAARVRELVASLLGRSRTLDQLYFEGTWDAATLAQAALIVEELRGASAWEAAEEPTTRARRASRASWEDLGA